MALSPFRHCHRVTFTTHSWWRDICRLIKDKIVPKENFFFRYITILPLSVLHINSEDVEVHWWFWTVNKMSIFVLLSWRPLVPITTIIKKSESLQSTISP
ncbi:hypothetical protein MHYP_G00063130 [Metynnis hypsauchen]